MKKLALLVFLSFLVVLIAGAAFVLLRPRVTGLRGPTVYVMLDEPHGLVAGDAVTLKGMTIGRVESVDLKGGRVRVAVRLDPDRAEALSRASTFKPEGWVKRELSAYVLEPGGEPLRDGATVEGCDSTLELLLKQGQRKMSEWIEQAQKALDEIDVSSLSKEVGSDLRQLRGELAELATETEGKARDGYTKLKPEVDRLVRDLERLGKSKEAQELRRHFEELLSGRGT